MKKLTIMIMVVVMIIGFSMTANATIGNWIIHQFGGVSADDVKAVQTENEQLKKTTVQYQIQMERANTYMLASIGIAAFLMAIVILIGIKSFIFGIFRKFFDWRIAKVNARAARFQSVRDYVACIK